ncbi:MAG: hypothetical protein KAH86_07790 [Methanosarcinales archaeon]|nr:hypothetical protein [Methanosarcinales archaeon]
MLKYGTGRTELTLDYSYSGDDISIVITGGRAHVGAVAVSYYRDGGEGVITEIIVVPPHKEGEIASMFASTVAKRMHCTAVCTAGIHLDDITKEEIGTINANAVELLDVFIQKISQ